MILFCLPYAGGSSSIYCKWKKYLNAYIQLEAIELRARGKRYKENFYKNLDDAIEDIFQSIKPKITQDEYTVFGYSMGSLLAYELYYKISSENLRKPKHMFFAAYQAPSEMRRKKIYRLPDDKFKEEIIHLGGTPKEVANNKKLFNSAIPILRRDFKMIEDYNYKNREEKIQCDISILYGNNDDITQKEILSWQFHSNKKFNIYDFDGDHFF